MLLTYCSLQNYMYYLAFKPFVRYKILLKFLFCSANIYLISNNVSLLVKLDKAFYVK